ncbi:MAG: PEP-CTERM sorting domain-containing protein [Verrucomicrobiota bacterium]
MTPDIQQQKIGLKALLSATALAGLALHPLGAATISSDTDGNWDAGSSWQGGAVPGSGDNAQIVGGDEITVQSAGNQANLVHVGESGASGTLTIDSGDLTNSQMNVGRNDPGEDGRVNVNGGILTIDGPFRISQVGQSGGLLGEVVQTGGTVNANSDTTFSQFNNGLSNTGLYSISGGTANLGELIFFSATNNNGTVGTVDNTFRVTGDAGTINTSGVGYRNQGGTGFTRDDTTSSVTFDFIFSSSGVSTIDALGSTIDLNIDAAYGGINSTNNLTLSVNLNNLSIFSDESFLLFDASGGGTIAGTFKTEDLIFDGNPNITDADVRYEDDQIFLDVTAIPEPNVAALVLGGLGLLLASRRRRR